MIENTWLGHALRALFSLSGLLAALGTLTALAVLVAERVATIPGAVPVLDAALLVGRIGTWGICLGVAVIAVVLALPERWLLRFGAGPGVQEASRL